MNHLRPKSHSRMQEREGNYEGILFPAEVKASTRGGGSCGVSTMKQDGNYVVVLILAEVKTPAQGEAALSPR